MKMRRAWAGVAAVAAAALVGALGAVPVSAYAETVTVKTADELATAINAGNDVVLGDNITASVTVPADKTVTIDLGGHTLTNEAGKHTITNNGTLTITGAGTVDNVSHAHAAVYNQAGATATLGAANYTRSKEAGTSPDEPNGNSYYNVVNQGTMTIDSGAVVKQDGHFSSLVENGWYNGNQNTTKAPSKLTINGGSFSGGINTIKNDDWGELTINDGEFSNNTGSTLMNWNVAEVNGGTFSITQDGARIFSNGYGDDTMDKGELVINDGNFIAANDGAGDLFTSGKGSVTGGTVAISGGTFQGKLDGIETNGIDVSVSGGAYTDVNVTRYVDADSATTSSLDMFVVGSADGVVDGSVAAVEVNGKKVYFDSVEAAENFAKENGADGEVLPVERTKYIVTYVANGKTVKTQTVKPGDALGTLPEAGEYEGYTFDGWYVDVTEGADGSADGTKIDETYKPTGDVTVTAMWTENEPSTPSTPSTPAAGSTDAQPVEAPKKALPQTGDTTNAALPVAIAIAGFVVIAAAVALRKRHN